MHKLHLADLGSFGDAMTLQATGNPSYSMRNLLAFDTGLGRNKNMAWPQYAKNSKGGDLTATVEKTCLCCECFLAIPVPRSINYHQLVVDFHCRFLKFVGDTYIFLLSTERVSFGGAAALIT